LLRKVVYLFCHVEISQTMVPPITHLDLQCKSY
jgi:hypothetical protein